MVRDQLDWFSDPSVFWVVVLIGVWTSYSSLFFITMVTSNFLFCHLWNHWQVCCMHQILIFCRFYKRLWKFGTYKLSLLTLQLLSLPRLTLSWKMPSFVIYKTIGFVSAKWMGSGIILTVSMQPHSTFPSFTSLPILTLWKALGGAYSWLEEIFQKSSPSPHLKLLMDLGSGFHPKMLRG